METREKINKKVFLQAVAKDNGFEYDEVLDVYDAIVEGIKSVVRQGQRLTLTGFGTFYLAKHKGHPVQFEGKDGGGEVNDYVVFKFSSSDVLNKQFREEYRNGDIKVHVR